MNNNNTNNRYYVIPCPLDSIEFLFSIMFLAEKACFKNKHNSFEACKVHYHPSLLYNYVKDIILNGLKVGKSRCFVLDYPVLREIFYVFYFDRIIHHMVAPVMTKVAECIHMRNGNISHGNRIGHSAFTAALAILKSLKEITNNWTEKAWVTTKDYSGFFMSLLREKVSLEFQKLAYTILDMKNPITKFLVEVLCFYITANPIIGCIKNSPQYLLNLVPKNKSLFGVKEGYGLPIGNYPSQIMANLYRGLIDHSLSKLDYIKLVVFVDDRIICSKTLPELKNALNILEENNQKYGLVTNTRKTYVLKADKGVKFCGYFIKCDRIYISNRVVNACKKLVYEYRNKTNNYYEEELARRLNCYFGIMSHCRSYNILKTIAKRVLEEHKTLYFYNKKLHLVCCQKYIYTNKYKSILFIKSYKRYIDNYYKIF